MTTCRDHVTEKMVRCVVPFVTTNLSKCFDACLAA